MSWLNKFQQGGQALQVLSQISNLVQKAAQGDGNAAQEVANLVQNGDPQLMSMIQNASPDLYQAMQQIAEQVTSMMRKGGKLDYIHSLKCGGKTKKKENGGKAVRTSKCGCMLKRVGGRIVEIDTCTGKLKNGGSINKFLMGGSYFGFFPEVAGSREKTESGVKTADPRTSFLRAKDLLNIARQVYLEIPYELPYREMSQIYKDAAITYAPYVLHYDADKDYWSPFNLSIRKPLYDLDKVAKYTQKLDDDRVRNIINLLRPGYFGSEAAPVSDDRTINIVEKQNNTRNLDNWRANFKSGGNSRYNGLTYDEGLARQLEMRQALANGWKPSVLWGPDDGMFGKKTAAAWNEYLEWLRQLSQAENAEMNRGRSAFSAVAPTDTSTAHVVSKYPLIDLSAFDHSGVGEVPYAGYITPHGYSVLMRTTDTHRQLGNDLYSRRNN